MINKMRNKMSNKMSNKMRMRLHKNRMLATALLTKIKKNNRILRKIIMISIKSW